MGYEVSLVYQFNREDARDAKGVILLHGLHGSLCSPCSIHSFWSTKNREYHGEHGEDGMKFNRDRAANGKVR